MMKAARIHAYGGVEELRLEQVERPEPGPEDVLVRVRATSVNPVDCKIRQGVQRAVVRRRMPTILGMDVSGEVAAVGSAVRDWREGDEVWASPDHTRDGTYAEYVLVKQGHLARKPASVSHEEAAAIPLAGLTAYDCLLGHAKLESGERVFIQAGSGGVGHLAIQIARHLGAHVITSCSGRNEALVREFGAHEVIDYTQMDLSEGLPQGLDVVLDAMGIDEDSWVMLNKARKGGRVSSITSGLPRRVKSKGAYLGVACTGMALGTWVARGWRRGVNWRPVVRTPSREHLEALGEWVEAGALRPHIDRTYELEEIAQAHEYSESGRVRGKLVVRL